MPNQRKKGKVLIGGYVPRELGTAFKKIASERGLTVKDLLEELIRKETKKDVSNGAPTVRMSF